MKTGDYLRQILKQRDDAGKWTQERVAVELDVAQSTVHRWVKGSEPDGYYRDRVKDLHARLTGQSEPSFNQVRMVKVIGSVQAGVWGDSWQWDGDEVYEVPIPADAALEQYKLFGAEVRGPSMDKRYPAGTIIVFSDAIETGEEVIANKRYIVEREREDGDRETTVKTLWQDENGDAWLLPESNDPRFQEPIAIETDNEFQTIRVIGRVWYAVTREG